jgi:excisionase family DNA binding protein
MVDVYVCPEFGGATAMPDDIDIDELLANLTKPKRPPDPADLDLLKNHLVLNVDEVARLLRLSRMAAYKGVWDGEIPSVKVGRRILVPVAGLKTLLGLVETDGDETQPNEGEAA